MTASQWSFGSFLNLAGVLLALHEEPVAQNAGVVHEAVETAHRAVSPVDERADVGLVRDVEAPSGDLPAPPARLAGVGGEPLGLRETRLVDVADGHEGPGFGEPHGEVPPHPGRGP